MWPPPPSAPCCCSAIAARLLSPTLAALNSFLVPNGRDLSSQLGSLAEALHGLVLRGLGGRDTRLRDASLAYLRCQLALGALPRGSQLLQDLQDWVERELQQPSFKW